MRILLLLLFAASAYAGQSLVLTPGLVSSALAMPNTSNATPLRTEFQVHNIVTPASITNIAYLDGIGLRVQIAANGQIHITDLRDTLADGEPCFITPASANILIRVQRDPVGNTHTCESWNADGSGYAIDSQTLTAQNSWPYTNGSFGGALTDAKIAFFRTYTTLVDLRSRPPTTAQSGSPYFQWKFEGDLTDASGNGRTMTLAGATYTATPTQAVVAEAKTTNSTTYSAALPMRAGHTTQMDGTASFSMADAGDSVTYFWQQLSGPSTVKWSSRTAGQPTISGITRGTYVFQLKVVDAASTAATGTLEVGAVAMDDNGVVIFPDTRLDKIFGPTIALGRNPWTWHDERSLATMDYHLSQLGINGGPLTQDWLTPLAGTVSFAQGSTTVTGVGTDFQNTFCNGGTTWDGADMVLWWDVSNPDSSYGRTPKIGPSNKGRAAMEIASCNSPTSITLKGPWLWSTDSQSGRQYSRTCCGWWYGGTGGELYYDGPLGLYAMYYRTGLEKYRTAARWMADGALGHGWIGYGANISLAPRVVSWTSQVVRNFIDNEGVTTNQPFVRQLIRNPGDTPPASTVNIQDPREDGYQMSWRALQAIADTDSSARAEALAYLAQAYTDRWQPQQRANGNYWTDYFENNFGGGSYNPRNGSAIVNGSGIPATKCYSTAPITETGTGAISNGSTTLTGTGTSWSGIEDKVIEIYGQRGGNYYIFWSRGTATSATSITLSIPYDGTTSPGGLRVRVLGDNGPYVALWFARGTPYVQETKVYTCTWNSSTQITLDRPYEGADGDGVHMARANAAGRGSQPFMMGIIGTALNWAAEGIGADNPTLAANYRTLAVNVANWMKNYGYSTTNKGVYYLVDFPNCIPYQYFNCDWAASEARDLAAEAGPIMSTWYLNSPDSTKLAFGDEYYGAQWGKLGGPYSDGQYNQFDSVYIQGKYLGLGFGMGFSHQWPAARLGGVAAPDLRTYTISCVLPTAIYPTAAKQRVTVRDNNNVDVVTTSTCPAATMDVSVDRRMAAGGQYLRKIDYLTSGDAVIAPGEFQPLGVQ